MQLTVPNLDAAWIDFLKALSLCLILALAPAAVLVSIRILCNSARKRALASEAEAARFTHSGLDAEALIPRLEQVRRDYVAQLENLVHPVWRQRHLLVLARNRVERLNYFRSDGGSPRPLFEENTGAKSNGVPAALQTPREEENTTN